MLWAYEIVTAVLFGIGLAFFYVWLNQKTKSSLVMLLAMIAGSFLFGCLTSLLKTIVGLGNTTGPMVIVGVVVSIVVFIVTLLFLQRNKCPVHSTPTTPVIQDKEDNSAT